MKAGAFIKRLVKEEYADKVVVMAQGASVDGTGEAERWELRNDDELPMGVSLSLDIRDRLTIEGGHLVDTPQGVRWEIPA